MIRELLVKVVFLLVCATSASAAELSGASGSVNLAAAVEVLEDPGASLTLDDMRRPEVARRFRPHPLPGSDLNFGFTASAVWMRLRLHRADDAPANWLLTVPYGPFSQLTVHLPDGTPVGVESALPLNGRPYLYQYFAVPIELDREERTFYVRAVSGFPLTMFIEAWQVNAFNEHNQRILFVQGLYFGGVLMVALYNLLLWRTLSDGRFLRCALYVMFMGVAMLARNGFGRWLVWPDEPILDGKALSFFLCAAVAFAAFFTREILSNDTRSDPVRRLLLVFAWGLLLTVGLAEIGADPSELRSLAPFVVGLMILTLLTMFAGSAMACHRGRRDVRYFAISWGVLAVGFIAAALRAVGGLPTNWITAHAVQLSSALELLLLMRALSDIAGSERAQREAAQAAALKAKGDALTALKLSEERLERAVQERTRSLSQSLRELEVARTEQQHLLSLASHEFRTPAAIIKASLDSLQLLKPDLTPDIQERLDNIGAANRRLQKLSQNFIDQDRLSSGRLAPRLSRLDLGHLLREAVEGFQATDGRRVDVRLLTPEHAVVLEGDGALLVVALQNLLDNAVRHNPPDAGPVEVRMDCDYTDQGVLARIRVSDHGPGVPDRDKDKVFDRFFTSRLGVAGSGLGLSIVQRIALAHHGRAGVTDRPPNGAVFEIVLPLSQPKPQPAGGMRPPRPAASAVQG